MQKQIKISTKMTSKGKKRVIDGKEIGSEELQIYIKLKYKLDEVSDFSSFLRGKKDLEISYWQDNAYVSVRIETTSSIKENVASFNLYMGDCK